jgi:hypothetical protein
MRKQTAQLAFDFSKSTETDLLAGRLIACELVPNEFILELNRTLSNPDDLPAPSRLYEFPIEFMSAHRRRDGRSRLLLQHQDLADLPFVRRVAGIVGEPVAWEPEDEFGRARSALPRWWHAIDLMCEDHWRHLLQTRHLSDEAAIFEAVAIAVETPGRSQGKITGGRLSTTTARHILGLLGAAEPADRSHSALLSGGAILGGEIVERQGKRETIRYPINRMAHGAIGAWLMVLGVEDGWFHRRGQWLEMSPEGLSRRGAAA